MILVLSILIVTLIINVVLLRFSSTEGKRENW
jgi:hypothetical protein